MYVHGDNAEKDQYKLLELDNNLLKALKNNESVVFKGSEDDDLVICTENCTYDVRECESSNSLLLVPNLQFKNDLKGVNNQISNIHVSGINHKYLEIIPTKPQLDKILNLLESALYNGPEKEFNYKDIQLRSFEELVDYSQASVFELKELFSKIETITVDNKIRLLDVEYQFRALSFLLKSMEENSWPLDEIQKDESINAWKEIVPETILEQLFNKYTTESKTTDDQILYKYDETKVCQFFAKVLLHYAEKFNLHDFLQSWKDSVPEGLTAREEMLAGMAIIDRSAKPEVIWAFPEYKLPDTIPERFNILFKTKPKWAVAEITPYVQSLTTDKMDANAILAKYARASTVDGIRYYSAKHNN